MRRLLPLLVLLVAACDNQLAANQAALGEPCDDPKPECGPGLACYDDVPDGECSKPCVTDGDCGMGAVCVNGLCKIACATPADCTRGGFTCAGTYCAPALPDAGVDLRSLPPDLAIQQTDLASSASDGSADQSHPDLAMPDLAMPDFAMPDLAMPDLAMPDFAMPDLAMPDFAMPDLVMVAMPDLAVAGITCTGLFANNPMTENNVYISLDFSKEVPNYYALAFQSMLLGGYENNQVGYIQAVGLTPDLFHADYVGDASTTGVTGDQFGTFTFTAVPTVTVNVNGARGSNDVFSVTCTGTGPLHGCDSKGKCY